MGRLIQDILCYYRAYRDRFKLEILEAIIHVPERDKPLLFRAFDLYYDEEGIQTLSNMTRKQLAKQCEQYYLRLNGKDWKVEDAFRNVIRSIRRG